MNLVRLEGILLNTRINKIDSHSYSFIETSLGYFLSTFRLIMRQKLMERKWDVGRESK